MRPDSHPVPSSTPIRVGVISLCICRCNAPYVFLEDISTVAKAVIDDGSVLTCVHSVRIPFRSTTRQEAGKDRNAVR
ncbi:hypothetical protein BV20DRAFT_967691 [Pilatotrama ljubarskyi]|nr:hypothetical protein BV20DRAFT_967691 [Pilatotrama ljubarskyi]